jgi:hypothetical protein
LDFRFLNTITGVQVQGHTSSVTQLEEHAEKVELDLFFAKLLREVNIWTNYQRALKLHMAQDRDEKRQAAKDLDRDITNLADKFSSVHLPTSKLSEDGVLPYTSDALNTWAEDQKISKGRVYTIFLVRLDALGTKFFPNLNPAVRLVSDFIANNVACAAAVVIAPNTGKDDVYNEQSVHQAGEDVDAFLREDQWRLRVRRGSINVTEESIGGTRSKRPGCTTIWMLTSNEKGPETKRHVSVFDSSLLFKRLRPIGDLEVLRAIDYINPCAALVRSNSGGRSLSKAQRSKQWFTVCTFWDGIRSSVLG